jgi:hypothetical protein
MKVLKLRQREAPREKGLFYLSKNKIPEIPGVREVRGASDAPKQSRDFLLEAIMSSAEPPEVTPETEVIKPNPDEALMPLKFLRALGDCLVSIEAAIPYNVEPFPDTVAVLGHLIVEQAETAAARLGFSLED